MKTKRKSRNSSWFERFVEFDMFSKCCLLSALFRLGSRLYCLSRRFQSVCCTLSFVSNHRNLLIAVSVASYYVISERWFFHLFTLHRSVKAHGNENLAFKVCLPKIRNRLSEYTLYFLECCTFVVSMIFHQNSRLLKQVVDCIAASFYDLPHA